MGSFESVVPGRQDPPKETPKKSHYWGSFQRVISGHFNMTALDNILQMPSWHSGWSSELGVGVGVGVTQGM